MKKILVILVCVMAAMSTVSIKAQNANLSEGQWKHGLAIGAQWIAYDLGFGKAEKEVIDKLGENYSIGDLRALYGSKSNWVTYYDKLVAHEGESGDIDKLLSIITSEYKPSIKGQVKKDVEKYNQTHSGNEVGTSQDEPQTPAASTNAASDKGSTNASVSSDTKAKDAKENKEEESHGGHGFLYFISLIGLALGALGTFLAMQARKESQAIMNDANSDINNMQKQIDSLRAKLNGKTEGNNKAATLHNKPEVKVANGNLAHAQKIDFDSKADDKKEEKTVKKPEPKKDEVKKEEVKKVEPKKEEPKQEEAKKQEPKKEEPKKEETTAAFGDPRILYMAKPDENDNFSRSSSSYESGNSIFELTTMDGKSGSFTVINKTDAQKLALLMPGDTISRACSGNNIQSTAGKKSIITDRAGRAQLENGKWHIVVKAIVHFE